MSDTSHIALLRGNHVGVGRRVPMATLRYSIEKFDNKTRTRYLKLRKFHDHDALLKNIER